MALSPIMTNHTEGHQMVFRWSGWQASIWKRGKGYTTWAWTGWISICKAWTTSKPMCRSLGRLRGIRSWRKNLGYYSQHVCCIRHWWGGRLTRGWGSDSWWRTERSWKYQPTGWRRFRLHSRLKGPPGRGLFGGGGSIGNHWFTTGYTCNPRKRPDRN